jgi:USP6 N-terminal-like protein
MIRLHDVYEMHSIFKPGFPGLLEGFYVQEKLIEYLMPTVYTSFVSDGCPIALAK